MTKPRQFCSRNHDTFRFGRDSGHRCLECRREDAEAVLALEHAEAAEREAERRRRWEEIDRRREQKYQAAIRAGGDRALEERWWRLSEEMSAAGSRFDLCQWPTASELPGGCFNRTSNVFCAKHSRQIDREAEKRRREREAAR